MQGHSHVLTTSGECIEMKGKKHNVRFVSYIDERNGLIFYLGKDDNLKSIYFIKPAKYKTNKGIGIEDTFYDLDSIYGEKSWSKHITGNCKIHGNLQFFPNDTLAQANLTLNELNELESHKLTIEKIILFESSNE